jgi:trehalose/maltose hydrolase-like predicted phosphorylase
VPTTLTCRGGTSDAAWCVVFEGYDATAERHREALCALGNGYLATRAAVPEATADGVHYPGTYRAGLYNRFASDINGQTVEDESLVNLPNWLPLTFRVGGGDWFSIDEVEILEYRQVLDLRHGLLRRKVRFCDLKGRQTTLREQRLVSMAQPHLTGLRMELTAENWSGELEVKSALDGRVVNDNVARYAPYNKRHLEPLATGMLDPEGVWMKVRTMQSRVEVALAARTRIWLDDRLLDADRRVSREAAHISERIGCWVEQGMTVALEKVAALYTSRDPAISESGEAAQRAVLNAPNFDGLERAHRQAWGLLWARCDIGMDHAEGLRAARLHIFHVLQTASPHTADLDVSIPARGLHGEAYRGHVFWDELFVFPFLTYRFPALARSLLLYRYRRLGAARRRAEEHGLCGAMFPWRSASTGREETPAFQLNPLSGCWMRDHTYLQRHIGAAVAYNVWHYVRVTGDAEFLCDYGAELLLEIARFWASLASYDPERDRFEIKGVVGPDEYHTAYPDAEEPGIDNNSYTNVMAVWTILKALEVLGELPPGRRAELWRVLKLTQGELNHWDRVSRRMRIIFHEDGVLSPFEGYERLKEFDVRRFREQHGEEHVDLVLEAHGDSANAYKVAKQADTPMLPYLLPEAELIESLARLGYPVDHEVLARTVDYHLRRTAHESSLSRVVYAGVLARVDPKASWRLFEKAQLTDLEGAGSAAEGIHLGAAAGTIQVLQSHYLGLNVQRDALCVNPAVPEALGRICLNIHYRGSELRLEATATHLKVSSASGNARVTVVCRGQRRELEPGATATFHLRSA